MDRRMILLTSQVLQILFRLGVPRGFLAMKMVGSPAMRCWECADGRYVYLHISMPSHSTRIQPVGWTRCFSFRYTLQLGSEHTSGWESLSSNSRAHEP